MNKGQSLWQKAKGLIPGGNMLLSKRSEMFLPEKWPSYFEKAKGCNVWDLEGKKLIDTGVAFVGGIQEEDTRIKYLMKDITVKEGDIAVFTVEKYLNQLTMFYQEVKVA